jgi:hypothetical protein
VVVLAAPEEVHRPRPVAEPEPEGVAVEGGGPVRVGRVQHDVGETARPVGCIRGVAMARVLGEDPHDPALGIREGEAVAPARLPGRGPRLHPGRPGAPRARAERLDVGRAPRGQGDAQQLDAGPRVERQDVVDASGGAEVDGAPTLGDGLERPDVAVECHLGSDVRHAEIDAPQSRHGRPGHGSA